MMSSHLFFGQLHLRFVLGVKLQKMSFTTRSYVLLYCLPYFKNVNSNIILLNFHTVKVNLIGYNKYQCKKEEINGDSGKKLSYEASFKLKVI